MALFFLILQYQIVQRTETIAPFVTIVGADSTF